VNISYDRFYGNLPYASVSVSSKEARIFFTLSARAMSSLFGWLTVMITYLIGRNFFHNRKIGFVSAILLISAYPFMLYSQINKYPAIAIFFFLLSFYVSLKLLEQSSLKYYVLNGCCAGLAISMIYYNGIAIFVLFCAHIMVVSSEGKIRVRTALLDKRLLWALFACCTTFLILNPRILTHGFMLFIDIMTWYVSAFGGSGRADFDLQKCYYEGIGAFIFHIRDAVGLPLLFAILFGLIVSSVKYKEHRNVLFVFVGTFYLLFSVIASEGYVVATAYPILFTLFARSVVDIIYSHTNKFSLLHQNVKHCLLIIIVFGVSIHGCFKIISQNMINAQPSTALQANQWIRHHLPVNSTLIVDPRGVKGLGDWGKIMSFSYQNGERLISHNVKDLLWENGTELFTAQYAVIGSRLFSELISDKHINTYPSLKKIHSTTGVGYGLKKAYQTYTDLLEKYALCVNEFQAGRWLGENQRFTFGPPFLGIPLHELPTFFFDPSYRTHGAPIKIYRLTPSFWRALEDVLIMPVETGGCDKKTSIDAVGEKAILTDKTVRHNLTSDELDIELGWRTENKKIMREIVFTLEHSSRFQKKMDFYYYMSKIINRIKGKDTLMTKRYKEFVTLKAACFVTRYKFIIPKNMAKGEYILMINFKSSHSEYLELGRFTL